MVEVEITNLPKSVDAAEVTSERGPGYTNEEVERGDYPPLLSLLPAELAAEIAAARYPDGEPVYTPRLRSVRTT
jgi:hypothetical protein